MQVKYREGGKKEASSSLYHLLPETPEMHFVKHVSEIQSEVRRRSLQLLFCKHFLFHLQI